MSIAEYNTRIIIFHVLIILGALWILLEGIQSAKNKTLRIVLIVITVIVLLTLIFSMFSNLSYRDSVSDYGKIVDISHTGSFTGTLDSYFVRIEKADGIATWYHVSIFSSSFKNSVEQLEIRGQYRIVCQQLLQLILQIQKIDIS